MQHYFNGQNEEKIITDSVLGGEYTAPPELLNQQEAVKQAEFYDLLRSMSSYLPRAMVDKYNVLLTNISTKNDRETFFVSTPDVRNSAAQEAVARHLKTTGFYVKMVEIEMMDFLILKREAYFQESTPNRIKPAVGLQHSNLVSQARTRSTRHWEAAAEESINPEGKIDLRDLSEYERNIDKNLIDLEPKDFCRLVMMDALLTNASDIHFEKQISTGCVRYRIDGAMVDRWAGIPLEKFKNFVFNFANLADINYVQTKYVDVDSVLRVIFPKNGKPKVINLRFNSAPTEYAPSLCIRVQGDPIRDINKLGFFNFQTKPINSAVVRPNGIIVVCGPTGGGKTNTLESISAILEERGDLKFFEIGDKCEFESERRVQVNINRQRGYDWNAAFKNALRQDPNIIILGECRSSDTAETAFAAANSGHLVMTTVHAGTVEQALNRLIEELAVKPNAIADSLNLIIAQNLVPVLCSCKVVDEEASALYREKVFKTNGCQLCLYKGFRGRTVIGEVLPMTKEIKKMLYGGESSAEIVRYAIDSKLMTQMDTCARLKVIAGVTSQALANAAITMAQVFASDTDAAHDLREMISSIETEETQNVEVKQ